MQHASNTIPRPNLPEGSLLQFLEHLPEGVLIRSVSTHKIMYVNPVMEKITGGLARLGQSVDQLFLLAHPDHIHDIAQDVSKNPNGGFSRDCLIRVPNGSYRWFNIRTFALPYQKQAEHVAIFVVDIHDRKLAQQSWDDAQDKDALTGLLNRVSFGRAVEALFQKADLQNQVILLGVLDLDGFRPLNDAIGRGMGDTILKQVSKRLCALYKDKTTSCIGRLGGDEFAVACMVPKSLENQHANSMASKILGNMKAPFFVGGKNIRIGSRLGMAQSPSHGMDFGSLLKSADLAVTEAKILGRGGHRLYEDGMVNKTQQRQDLDVDLQSALHNQEFTLSYQPKIDLTTNRCIGVEALIRWNRAGFGPVLPSVFIPALENSGLIVPLGDWIIHEACRQSQAWEEMGIKDVRVAVNVSAQQLSSTPAASSHHPDMGLHTTVGHALKKYPQAQLDIELTESAFMSNPDHAITALHKIRTMGVPCSIDDFGTGYSSLAYLKKFPVEALKIDRSFVMDMENSEDDVAIVSAIISMAHRLNLLVVAEGVENQAQVDTLATLGCDQIQGYVAAPSLTPDQFVQWYRDRSI